MAEKMEITPEESYNSSPEDMEDADSEEIESQEVAWDPEKGSIQINDSEFTKSIKKPIDAILADIERLPLDFEDAKKTADNLQELMTNFSELDVENESSGIVKAEIQRRHAEIEDTMQLCVETFNQTVDEYNSLEQRKAVAIKNIAAFEERAVLVERLCDFKYAEMERNCLNKAEVVKEMELEKADHQQFLEDKKAKRDELKKRLQIAKEKRANLHKNRQRKAELEESIKWKQQELLKLEAKKAESNKLQWEKEIEIRDKKAKTNCLILEAENLIKSNEEDLKKLDEAKKSNAENKMKLKNVAQQKLDQLLEKVDQENIKMARNLMGIIQQIEKNELEVKESKARLEAVNIKDSELDKRMQAMQTEFDKLDSELAETTIDDSEVPDAAEMEQLMAENEKLQREKLQMDEEIEATKAKYEAKILAEKERNERLKATVKAQKNVDSNQLRLSADFTLPESEQPKLMEKMKMPSPAKPKQQTKKKNNKAKKSQK